MCEAHIELPMYRQHIEHKNRGANFVHIDRRRRISTPCAASGRESTISAQTSAGLASLGAFASVPP
jgi:hypothetical protein